jgi:NAD(P)-dependent dehydrogenase (short-subunit alcohol dehydrogenase family)
MRLHADGGEITMTGICNGRVVIVTGAGNGLGRAYALALAMEGARVVVNDLGVGTHGEADATRGAAERVVEEIRASGGHAVANTDDVADWEAGKRIVTTAIEAFGDLHAVVNNAGFLQDRMFVSCTPDEWDAVLRVHLRGHFCTSRHAVDYWRGRHKAGHAVDARIVNTTSGAGLQGSIGQSAYSTAKGGIAILSLVQAAELARYGISVNAIAPNARTRMTQGAFATEMDRMENGFDIYAPENAAPLVAWLCSSESASITGQIFEIKGGKISVSQGWTDSPAQDKAARWTAHELGPVVKRLLDVRMPPKPVYGST